MFERKWYEVRFFMERFRKGDINDPKYREALIDTFVNKIYLYDDKMTILYNAQDSHSEITLDDLGLSGVKQVEYIHSNPNPSQRRYFVFVKGLFGIVIDR